MTTTTFHVDTDNIELVSELTEKRELSKILNFLLRAYKEDKGYVNSVDKVKELEAQLKKKELQYEAIKKEGQEKG